MKAICLSGDICANWSVPVYAPYSSAWNVLTICGSGRENSQWRQLVREPALDRPTDPLADAYDVELGRLGLVKNGRSLVESIMRLRALGEISDALETPALVELAVRVETKRKAPH
jgi:hypothetical protein